MRNWNEGGAANSQLHGAVPGRRRTFRDPVVRNDVADVFAHRGRIPSAVLHDTSRRLSSWNNVAYYSARPHVKPLPLPEDCHV